MKIQLCAAAVLALAVSTPALAQTVGSVGAAGNYVDQSTDYWSGHGSSVSVDGSVAAPVGAWTVTGNFNVDVNDSDTDWGTYPSASAHLTTKVGDSLRVGVFAAISRPNDISETGGGVEVSKYLGDITLSGLLAYGYVSDSDYAMVIARGEVRYFVTDDFRLDGGVAYSKRDYDPKLEMWEFSAGGEYKFANSGWSTFGRYTHTYSENWYNLNADGVKVGLRYTFGGSLKTRDRAGADLIDAGTLFGGF